MGSKPTFPACCHVTLTKLLNLSGQLLPQSRDHDAFQKGALREFSEVREDSECWFLLSYGQPPQPSLPLRPCGPLLPWTVANAVGAAHPSTSEVPESEPSQPCSRVPTAPRCAQQTLADQVLVAGDSHTCPHGFLPHVAVRIL